MIATRAPGYHTMPHVHESEQINFVQEGEIWFFVEDKAFQCKKGDFQRIPANKIHWAWNRSDRDTVVIEAHAPGLVGEKAAQGAVSLFEDGEKLRCEAPVSIDSCHTIPLQLKDDISASDQRMSLKFTPKIATSGIKITPESGGQYR